MEKQLDLAISISVIGSIVLILGIVLLYLAYSEYKEYKTTTKVYYHIHVNEIGNITSDKHFTVTPFGSGVIKENKPKN